MRADVTHTARHTTLTRISPPSLLALAIPFKKSGEPPLWILNHHLADLTQLPFCHHLLRLFHQRIACVVMGKTEKLAGFLDDLRKFLRLLQTERSRFIAKHMEPIFQRALCWRKMHVVRQRSGGRNKSAPLSFDFSVSEENAPQTSSSCPSMAAAMRCMAPIKAPRPPPIIPYLSIRITIWRFY